MLSVTETIHLFEKFKTERGQVDHSLRITSQILDTYKQENRKTKNSRS